jgi:hypothetical protein
LGITQEAWDAYFGDTDDLGPGQENKEKLIRLKHAEFTPSGYSSWITSKMKNSGLQFMMGPDNQLRAYNSDYTPYTGGAKYWYNDDWTKGTGEGSGYGDVLLIDASGNVTLGPLSKLDKESDIYKEYLNAVN